MDNNISKRFINTVASQEANTIDGDKKYDCQGCYRKSLPASMIAACSNGEAYCTVCFSKGV